MFEAQSALSKISIEQERYRLAKQRQDQTKMEKAPVEGGTQVQANAPVANAPPPKADPKAESWAQKNEWFGQDEVMTYAAFGIHRKLVEEEGFDPQADEYYSEIDKRMRTEFPQRFNAGRKNGGSARVASADTSASRTTKPGRRTVKLSPSQIAIAKKLGVPLEEYAKYVKD
jgi:GH15 family glucan-1,4-alpha-glucosidase